MDDHQDFIAHKRRQAAAMAADRPLQDQALDLLVKADRYDYSYQWTWLGLPLIQVPSDILAFQEIVWANRPTVIVETGVARGGSMVFFASLLQLLGRGRVIGVEVDLRDGNRARLADHPMSERIEIVDGSSIDPTVHQTVCARIAPDDSVMVVLDSNHTHDHVLEELRLYAPLVSAGQYLLVCDTSIETVPPQTHRPRAWGPGNNAMTALRAFLAEDQRFEVDREIEDKLLITAMPGGFLRRRG